MKIVAIAAMDENRVIGFENKIPWKLPEDMKLVSELTTNNLVLMGRSTYESLPEKFRPLPNRKNIVVSRNGLNTEDDIEIWSDLRKAINVYRGMNSSKILWIMGGQKIYEQTMQDWDEIYLTYVHGNHPGDTFFPQFEDGFELTGRQEMQSKSGERFEFRKYLRIKPA